jgi:hypothetical protein
VIVHLICQTPDFARALAMRVLEGEVPDIYTTRADADAALASYPSPMRGRYRVFSVLHTGEVT